MATSKLSVSQAFLQLVFNLIIDAIGAIMPDMGSKFMVAPKRESHELED